MIEYRPVFVAAESTKPVEYRQGRFLTPPGATEVLLVRHGESEPARPDQPFSLVDGQDDPGLAPEGHEHARRVAERLAAERVDAIYVSSLRRTSQTAAPLAARLSLTPVVEPELREVYLGEWEGGLFRRMVAEGHPTAERMAAEALAAATGSRPFAFLGADNGSVSHLVLTEARWILRRFNDTAHLGPTFSTTAAPPT